MEEWKKYKLEEIGTIVGGATPSTKEPHNYDGNISWITPKDLSNNSGRYISRGERMITSEGYNSCSCKMLPKGSVLFSSRAPIGYVAIASNELCTNQGFKSIIPNEQFVDSTFLYYLLVYNKAFIEGLGSGTTFKEVSGNVMKNVVVKIPCLEIQKQIANVLSSLDDKIEANRRINDNFHYAFFEVVLIWLLTSLVNDNLEQQAQSLFKSWFVDFEPFRGQPFVESELGMIPEGWKVEKIGSLPISVTDYVANGSFASLKENVKLYQTPEYAYFIRNTDLKSGKFEVYVDRHSYEFLSKSTLYGGEIIISNVGDVGSVHLCPYLDKPMTLGNNIIMLKPNKQYYSYYLYILFKWAYGNDLIMSIKGGSAQPKFNKTDFKSLKIIVPKDIVLEKYHSMISVLFNKMSILEDESRRLASLRDTLLPRLMSGEIKVGDVTL